MLIKKHLSIIITIILCVCGVPIDGFTQRNVSGVISDFDGTPLMSAVVREVGTKNHTLSDDTGAFYITTMNDDCTLSFAFIGFTTKTVKITQDTIIHVVLKEDVIEFISYVTEWLSIGAKYDAINSVIGLSFSNGYDELPLLRFHSFFDRFVYKMKVQTDFDKNNMFGANIGWMIYQLKPLIRCLVSAEYNQYHYSARDFLYRDINVFATFLKENSALTVKTGYQTLNDYNNWGVSLGLQKPIVSEKLSVGLLAGYYFDYLSYSLYFQGLIRYRVSIRLAYDRIYTYDFLNFGLNYFFPRW